MKQSLLMLLGIFMLANVTHASEKEKGGVNWMTWDEVQVAMKKEPRKVWVDIYTDWCGWCKVMDKKTFSNPDVIKYINKHFYAVKFNAERKNDIMFMGKKYVFAPENRANELAVKLMNGQMSYPTSIVMEENFQNPQPIPGYIPVARIESVLKYLGDGAYKTKSFEDYLKTFKPAWEEQPGEVVPSPHG